MKLSDFFALVYATYTKFVSAFISQSLCAKRDGIHEGHNMNTLSFSSPFALCTVVK